MSRNKRWSRGVLWFSLVLAAISGGALFAQSSTNYRIKKSVVDQGGGPSRSANYKIVDAIGQPSPVTVANSANYRVASGFFGGGMVVQTPVLLVSATTLDFGAQHDSLTFQISNTGGGTLNWTVGENPGKPWITSVTPASGSGNARVMVTVDRSQLTAGSDTGTLAVSSNGGNYDVTVLLARDPMIAPVVSSPQQIGAEFDVDISVVDVHNLFGLSFVLHYDTAVLDVVTPTRLTVVPGPFLGDDILFVENVDEAAGKIGIGITRQAGQHGVNGSGVVASVRFKSLTSTPSETVVEFLLSDLVVNDPTANPIYLKTGTARLTLEGTGLIVWPGDTNNDGIVDQADVLPLGQWFGKTGGPRQNASMAWIGQSATPWTVMQSTYADANGDGSVSQADVLPIGINFSKTHTGGSAGQLLAKGNSVGTAGMIKADIDRPQQAVGRDFFIKIRASEVTDLFGVSFELNYDQPGLMQILAVEPDSLLGSDVIFFSKVDSTNGKVSVGITKTAGQASSNRAGSVVRIKAVLTRQAKDGDRINLLMENVLSTDSTGGSLQLMPQASQIEAVAIVSGVRKGASGLITEYSLQENYPNPFNPTTTIHFALPEAGNVTLEVYNLMGQKVRSLISRGMEAGYHHVQWDATNDLGQKVASGIYLYRIQAGEFSQVKRMILMK